MKTTLSQRLLRELPSFVAFESDDERVAWLRRRGVFFATSDLRSIPLHLLTVGECRRLKVHCHGDENPRERMTNNVRRKFYWWRICQANGVPTGYSEQDEELMGIISRGGSASLV
mgnify:CR=1 FL=1